MIDIRGTFFLSGGGDENKTIIVDSVFLNSLQNNNILFIPIAKTSDMNGYKKSCKWVKNKLNKISKTPIEVSMMLDFHKYENINKFSAIYIGGGNTYKLLKLMKESNFLPILKKYIKNGGIIYGASAGAVLMGYKISTLIEEKYLIENKKHKYRSTRGFNLIGNYSVLTHYKEEEKEKIQSYFKNNNNAIIAIPEGAGLIIKDSTARIIGDQPVTIFRKDLTITKLDPTTIFVL